MSSNPSGSGPSTAAAVNSSPAGTPSSLSSMPSGQQASGIHTSSPAGTQPSSAGNTTAVSSNIIPNNPLYTVQYINDPAWPTELHLDPSVLNWSEWSCCLRLLCKQQGLGVWLEGTFAPPDPISDTCGYRVWTINDDSIQAFILQHVCKQDYKDICDLPSSHTMFSELHKCYEKLGSHIQILLMEKAIRMEFTLGTHLSQTWDELDTLMRKIKAMGPLDYNQLQIACAIKGLGNIMSIFNPLCSLSQINQTSP